MPIPKSRLQLVTDLEHAFRKMHEEFDQLTEELADKVCVDEWRVRDLLAVRAWWSEQVVRWIRAGRKGEKPTTPKQGYRWSETPKLNQVIINECNGEPLLSLLRRIEKAYREIRKLIDDLDDEQLLGKGIFEWAGNYPIARWISINATRQYTTARTYIRKVTR